MTTDTPPEDQPKDELEFIRQWLEAIDLSEDEEKDWRDTADRACDTYRGGSPRSSSVTLNSNLNTFNIFHSNVETLVPALYNSTPIPDVRRRFNDDDPLGKEVSEIFERSLSYQIDAYDFDQAMLSAVRDMAITSRGIIRVRYEPSFDTDGMVAYEQTNCEYVPWRGFRRGPGKSWKDVPWIAFENFLSRSEVEGLLEGEKDKARILKELKFSYSAEPKKEAEQQGENLSVLAARARVWEIWDKDNRKVHFISPDYTSRRITSVDDPLGLKDFFPIPRPLAAIVAPDSLVPITLLQVYETLLEELNIVQRRIMKLTAQLRPRGWYAGLQASFKEGMAADDGELVPLEGMESFITQGKGLDSAITWFPLDPIINALQQLVEQRERIKAAIYEVTGLSDIVRGASDPDETATAQNLKSQWGSLRIQRMQADVARFARDLFRLKSEIMANKFSFDTFMLMTGLKFPTEQEKQQAQQMLQMGQQQLGNQPGAMQIPGLAEKAKELQEIIEKPSREQIEQAIKNDAVRGFRVDIESDSTIRGDVQRNQEQMALFLQGTAQYLSAVGPLVQEGAMPQDLALEIFSAFTRSFRLGKQAEDALDRLADQARKGAQQPKPPSPEELKMQIERERLDLDKQKMQMELQMKQAELELEKQKAATEMQLEQAKAEQELKLKEMELQHDMQIKAQEAQQAAQLAAQEAQIKADIQRSQAAEKIKHDAMHAQVKVEQERAAFDQDRGMKMHSFKEDEGRKAQAFKSEEKRRNALTEAESGRSLNEIRIQNERASKEDKERVEKKSKPMKIKFVRDADKRLVEAEVQ